MSLIECEADVKFTDPFDPVISQPMEGLDEEEEAKHERERNVEFVTEDCECKERLCDEEPKTFVEPLFSQVS